MKKALGGPSELEEHNIPEQEHGTLGPGANLCLHPPDPPTLLGRQRVTG